MSDDAYSPREDCACGDSTTFASVAAGLFLIAWVMLFLVLFPWSLVAVVVFGGLCLLGQIARGAR